MKGSSRGGAEEKEEDRIKKATLEKVAFFYGENR